MREKIAQYMDLYYAGSGLSEDLRQQLLQEALYLYDSLILEGKSEQESYAQVIAWIGAQTQLVPHSENTQKSDASGEANAFAPMGKRICTAIAVMLYILCPIPLILFQNVIGLSCLLGMVAVGVAMQIIAGSGKTDIRPKAEADPLRKSIDSLLGLILLAIYLIVSFRTHAWWITWIIFPIGGAVKDLVLSLAESLGFEAEVDTVSGSFRSDIPTTASSKGVYTCGNGECGISVDTVSGSITIQKK